jgi:uncharacterized protein (TIGR03000 family)
MSALKWAALTAIALAAVAWTAVPAPARPRGGGGGRGGGHGGHSHGGAHRGSAHSHRGPVIFLRAYPRFRYYYPGYGYGYYYPGDNPLLYGYDYVPDPNDPDLPPVPWDASEKDVVAVAKPSDNIGRVRIRVPEGARLWVDGQATKQTGSQREFETPPLQPGSTYQYSIKAQWSKDGQTVERTLPVRVRANRTTAVDFTAPK